MPMKDVAEPLEKVEAMPESTQAPPTLKKEGSFNPYEECLEEE